jgi:hypothetical protein
MRKPLFLLTALLLLGGVSLTPQNSVRCPCLHSSPFACTSFAVYSEETFYGMNFDYPDVEIRFTINSNGDMKVFQMEFLQEDDFVPTVGMNSGGLFASCQMLYPEAEHTTRSGEEDVYTWQVYGESLFNFNTVEEVTEFISDRRVLNWSVTLHDLFADTRGDAMVVEAGDEDNVITRIEDDFIVMTNFPNGDFRGKSYQEVEGVGADRYKVAYQHILNNLETFNLGRGLETLEKAVSTGDWPTQCSMVFDPGKGEVFIALERDFKRIWMVSIEDETIETYSGFGEVRKTHLDSSGVLATDLEKIGISRGTHWGYIVGLVVVLAVGGWFFIVKKGRGK